MSIDSHVSAKNVTSWLVRINGTVQGVGFRPTVYKLACELGIKGSVLNDGEGVLIQAFCDQQTLSQFIEAIKSNQPPLAHIERVNWQPLPEGRAPDSFTIGHSQAGSAKTNISADAATCMSCMEDVLSPFSRRYRYPFTNCTHCGPRLSIIKSIPYDRANTSMSAFPMCADCLREYEDPADRRFHAQPNACYACGPKAWLERSDGRALCTESLTQLDQVDATGTLIKQGQIVAIKGIGGFHLACDATRQEVVVRLRERKQRFHKPFALIARDLKVIERHCQISKEERALLQHHSAPIVLLKIKADGAKVAESIAPGQNTLGFMLPYTPLHHLILRRIDRPVVLTSGNLSDEPQCIDNDDARARLGPIADYFLFHDRDIVNRIDDSVLYIALGQPAFLRRARGFAPAPLPLPPGFLSAPNLLAMGGELKSTFCLINENAAILSQHMGDLEDARTYSDYVKNLSLYESCFQHHPQRIAIDCHPDYLSSNLGREMAQERKLTLDEIQHHHAHIASCLADNDRPLHESPVLGIVLDGLGYGLDNTFWGGEFMLADYTKFERLGTFKPVELLGGTQAMREPWRNTYAHIMSEIGWERYKMEYDGLALTKFLEERPLESFKSMLKAGFNSPLASSCGRLFDAVAAAVGICREAVSYEGQAAVEFEALTDIEQLDDQSPAYPFTIPRLGGGANALPGLPYVEPIAMWHALLADILVSTPPATIAARFHLGLAKVVVAMVKKLEMQEEQRIFDTVALSGGVFQNRILLELVSRQLRQQGFQVLSHRQVPANDGGLSYGQAVISAALQIKSGEN